MDLDSKPSVGEVYDKRSLNILAATTRPVRISSKSHVLTKLEEKHDLAWVL